MSLWWPFCSKHYSYFQFLVWGWDPTKFYSFSVSIYRCCLYSGLIYTAISRSGCFKPAFLVFWLLQSFSPFFCDFLRHRHNSCGIDVLIRPALFAALQHRVHLWLLVMDLQSREASLMRCSRYIHIRRAVVRKHRSTGTCHFFILSLSLAFNG